MQINIRFILLSAVSFGVAAAFAGPVQDFEAAVKAGHPLSAEAAYREILKAGGGGVAPSLHYRAAEVAAELGKDTQQKDRWLLYLRLEKNWTPEVEGVLWRLCAEGSDVDLYKRLAAHVPATETLWRVGESLLKRIREQRRAPEALRLADVLFSKFAQKSPLMDERREWILEIVYSLGENAGTSYPREELRDLLARHPGLGELNNFMNFLCSSDQREAFPKDFAFTYLLKHGGPVRDELLKRMIEQLNDYGFPGELKPEKDGEKIKEREALAKSVKAAHDKIFDGRHPWAARAYVEAGGLRAPDLLYPGWKKDAPAPGLAADAKRLLGYGLFKTDVRYRNETIGALLNLCGWKRLGEADAKAFKALETQRPQLPKGFEAVRKAFDESKDPATRAAKARELVAMMNKDFIWTGEVERRCNALQNEKNPEAEKIGYEYRRKLAEATGSFDAFSGYVPKDADAPYPGVDMKKMSARARQNYSYNCWNRLKPGDVRRQILLDYLKSGSYAEMEPGHLNWVYGRLSETQPLKFMETYPLDYMADQVYGDKTLRYSFDLYLFPVRWARLLKRDVAAYDARYFKWAESLEPVHRVEALARFICNGYPYFDEKGEIRWSKPIVDGHAEAVKFLPRLTAALAAVPDAQAGALEVWWGWGLWGRLRQAEAAVNDRDVKDADKGRWPAVVHAFYDVFCRKALAGAPVKDGYNNESSAWHYQLEKQLAASNAVATATYARRAARGADDLWHGRLLEDMKALRALGNLEALYVYVDGFPPNTHASALAEATKLRAEVSSKLPGIYPVAENDPAYPLYVAADELARKNSERAWQILREPKNQAVFEREALKLPPDFVVWGVEQLRLARGEKDKLLVKARQIATSVLAQESKVTPEVAAAMILSIAEGYRDQQNFEAAKLEYQTLRENPAYHATKYGKQAMFRAVDLQIETGNAQGVEATMEYWLSQSDRDVQAQAHYFLAKMAFARKDYDETIKQLRDVFAIHYTHTEGRFLHGQWKLATNSEVDDTEVPVGDLSERSLIRPGSQLVVTVQDRNLSVAGGGASIPVVVTSAPSGDRETVGLYPTSRDPSVFRGVIDVRLGKACPSNRVVEVTGDDTVSYVIDPQFLKERGLPANEPKSLKVIDDAKLAIGAGAPRTDEKKTEKGLKDILDDKADLEDSGVARRLRPGSPLYVVVQDRDESKGGAGDGVRVTVTTSSGDRVENFELKEEKPFTGVFRGRLETALPPPRAYASDTAAGLNPGDAINSTKKEGWKSLSDGQPGKWFAVDTMGSYLFSEIAMETPNAADVKALRLVGTLGKKTMTLGQLPAANEVTRLYLRRQQRYDRSPRRALAQLAAFYQTDRAPRSTALEKGVQFRALQDHDRDEWQTAYFHGPFAAPKGLGTLRLRLVAQSPKKDALKTLWVSVALDGEEVFSGQGAKLRDALVSCDLAPGCHNLEVAVVAANRADAFDLLWEPDGRDPEPIPADWFDETKHAALKSFVKDVVKIRQTKTGFEAMFAKPTRLRSFRWEFVDVKSPEVAVTSVSAKDAAGATILPVESDFSTALGNQTLEVAPGDTISVQYEDRRTTSGEKKVLQSDIGSSFNNAHVGFVFEGVNRYGSRTYYEALRFQPGDRLLMRVDDADCDVSDAADKVKVTVRNAKGESVEKTLLEVSRDDSGDTYGVHAAAFFGLLRTCPEGDTNAPPSTLRVAADDCLTLSYDDRENTDPGVPTVRTASIFAARPAVPKVTLFQTARGREIDRSPDAKARLDRIRRRPGNENVTNVYRYVCQAVPMKDAELATTNPVPVNVATDVPIRVTDRSRARHEGSKIRVEAVAHSERALAEEEGREPEKVVMSLGLAGSLHPFRQPQGAVGRREAFKEGVFQGVLRLSLGPIDPNIEVPEDAPPVLCVTGSDLVDVSVLGEDGEALVTKTLKFVSDATLALTDSSFEAERDVAHVGEVFFVVVDDADRDLTDEPDTVRAEALSVKTGARRPVVLTETMPHSGLFTARLRPTMFAPGEAIPSVATGGVATANEVLTDDRFAVGYGDRVVFRYVDETTLPGTPAPRALAATGTVFRGSNGDVRLFSKRFADRDAAVLVQFRLAECLFEQAKEHRRLKQPEKSSADIAEGRFILEEALKNYPDSSHVVQGEFLLANLCQELATEARDAGDEARATRLYQDALSRFSQILGTWPEGEYAARSQYHKAFCLEMLKDYARASEEYVKMTYLYPESELVGDATVRLATYYYTQEKRYDVAGHIYRSFQKRFPQHAKAARCLFMAGSCYVKQAETVTERVEKLREAKKDLPKGWQMRVDQCYRDAAKTFTDLVEEYRDSAPAKLKAQALYWAGDVYARRRDYPNAFRCLKRCVFEYPETEWARRARGLLLQESRNFEGLEEE